MTLGPLLVDLAALAMTASGVAALHRAWSNRARSLVVVGWLLIAASLVVWTIGTSAEKGVAHGLIAFAIIGMGAALAPGLTSGPVAARPFRRERAASNTESLASAWRPVATFMLAVPGAAISALVVTTAIFTLGLRNGWEMTGNVVTTLFLFPMLWVLFTFLSLFPARWAVRGMSVLAPGLCAGVFLMVMQ